MAVKNIKKGDTVYIISGKDKGKKGKVLSVLPKEGKIIVEGVNIVKTRETDRELARWNNRSGGTLQF